MSKDKQVVTSKDVGTAPAAIIEEANKTTVQTPAAVNKSAIATAIFDESYKNYATDPKSVPQRKDILDRCIKEAGLTQAGAATYLQNYKRKHGYSKASEAPAAGTVDADAAADAAREDAEKGE